LSYPVIYTGSQDLMLLGNGATIDGETLLTLLTANTLVAEIAANMEIPNRTCCIFFREFRA
jgi:hypothetical protein